MEKKRGITLTVSFDGKLDKEITPTAYVFSREGDFHGSFPLKEGQAQIDLDDEKLRRPRIFVGPALEGRRTEAPTPELMERLHAYEAHYVFDPENRICNIFDLPSSVWKRWLWCRCRVRGRVVRPVTVGEVTSDMPICHARVHICEVDPLLLLIPRLPDPIIWRLRKEILTLTRPPFPVPPEPDPYRFTFDPGVVDPSPEAIARMNLQSVTASARGVGSKGEDVAFNPQPEPPGSPEADPVAAEIGRTARPIEGINWLNPQPEPPAPMTMLSSLPVPVQAALMSGTLPTVRRALLENVALIRPFLCFWPWIWPYFTLCEELAVVYTDTNGRFEKDVWYPCAGDHPDLYFWVEYCLGGSWAAVYHPPRWCNTYWNYVCGSDVLIRVLDPRVPWCGDPPLLPGKQLAVMTIGHRVSLKDIQHDTAGVDEGLTASGQPFGASLEPHVWFGDGLIASGITHFRWSYRRMDGADTWHALDRQVVRHYAVIDPTPPDFPLTFKPYLLGPDPAYPTQNLFRIPPKDPPAGSFGWAPMVDERENSASGFFLSHLLSGGDALAAAGLYELKLELFKGNVPVNLTAEGVLLKQPTISGPLGAGTVPTRTVPHDTHFPHILVDMNDRVIRDGSGDVTAFRLVLHVDNNPCEAFIYETAVGALSAGPCGFITYPPAPATPGALIRFKARHPNDFATFSFGTYRGSSGILAVASASGPVGTGPINGFARDAASNFTKNVLVSDLVGTCPGGKAAFAEYLHVDALATDGYWATLDYLDRDAVPKAFALTPP